MFQFTLTLIYIILFNCLEFVYGMEKGSYIGCYKYEENQEVILNVQSVPDCVNNCEKNGFKFAILSNSNTTCFCNNFLGELGNSSPSEKCNEKSVYSSRDSIPSLPKNFRVVTLSEESVRIAWEKPDNAVEVTSYEITASVLSTFSQYPLRNTTWVYSNNTFQTALNLQPASKYNLTIRAKSSEGLGNAASEIVETPVGIPDNIPPSPIILSRSGSQMTIKIYPVVNNNGPISYYRVLVLNEAAKQMFQPEFLKNYQDSLEDNLNYYITAELTPEQINENFVIGDEKHYGKYFNAPLLSSVQYDLIVGIISSFNGHTKVAYSNSSRIQQEVLNGEPMKDTSLVTVLLIIGIIILSILLLVGVIGFFILKRRFMTTNRHNRLSEQELTLQGPMISVENSAYLPEDEQIQINHYKNLKQRIRIFSLKDELSVDAHMIIGVGKFGTVCKAFLRENTDNIPLAAYSIPDKSLAIDQKKVMLKNLDMLIKCGKHDNLVELIGTSESSHMLYVLFKHFPMNLKEFLINNRVQLPNRFFKISESQILGIITQISHGLIELEKNRIYHTKLCARNIMLTEDLVPKIFGFGLADYYTEKDLDYSRWTAVEVLNGNDFNSRSTIWSFGVLLWEVCALGATPYNNISKSSELIHEISRGTRLPQLKYFNDDVYQIMLYCWQIDMGERPNCETLSQAIENLHENTIIPFISFNLYQMFQYEQYKPELEFSH